MKKTTIKITWSKNIEKCAFYGYDQFSVAKEARFETTRGCLAKSCSYGEIDDNGETIRQSPCNIEFKNQVNLII